MENLRSVNHRRAAAFVILLTLTMAAILPALPALASTSATKCSDDTAARQESTILSSLDQTRARIVAQTSVDADKGTLTPSFFGMVGIFRQNSDCSPVLEVIKLGFSLSDSSGIQRVVTVTEIADASAVINATNDTPTYFGYLGYQAIWSGYTYYDSSGVREAGASGWTVPTPSEAFSHECDLNHCDYSFWVGISEKYDGSSGIVQTGSNSGLYCAFGSCSYYHYTWIDDLPNPGQQCFQISYGDSMTGKAYFSHRDFHGNPYYDTYIKDNSNGQSCSSDFGYNLGWTTYYGQFIGERIKVSGATGPSRLPSFAPQETVTGGYYINGQGTYTTIGTNWYEDFIMNNQQLAYRCNGQYLVENICNGPVSSGTFTEMWQSSDGT